MALVGARRSAVKYPDDLVVVVIPDSGRSYISKIFDDEWMAARGMLEEP
jgi:cystathionine beta-synthase